MEFEKSVSQPPDPKPTWPNASRCSKPASLKAFELAMKP